MNTDPATVAAAGLVIVDKPAGMTSHDVVSRCRKAFGTRRVGHAGTLDPMATGVLVVGIERATKLLGLLALTTKSYAATIRLGAATTTDDADGDVVSSMSAASVDAQAVAAAMESYRGVIEQVPSSVSAIKVNGKRAYTMVRDGETVELSARPVTVSRFDIVDHRYVDNYLDVDVVVDCSTGTYIRSLARDLGDDLEVGGHLTALRRTMVGPFGIDTAIGLDDLAQSPRLSHSIDEAVVAAFPQRAISADEAAGLGNGRWLEPVGMRGIYAAVTDEGRAIALLKESGRRASVQFVVRPANLT